MIVICYLAINISSRPLSISLPNAMPKPSESTSTSTINNDSPAIKDASAPFDHPDADVIIRSSDNVDFRTFRVFLSVASPVFRDMFRLPQPPAENNDNDTKDGLPIVRLTEGSKTLETLFSMCYPMTLVNPVVAAPEELEDTKLLMEAALKYEVAMVEEQARTWLIALRFLKKDPVMIYIIACQWNLEKEARVAARFAIGHAIHKKPLEKELDMMTKREFQALLQYIVRCNAAMAKYAVKFEFGDSNHEFGCGLCGISKGRNFPKWLEHYLQGVVEAVVDDRWNMKRRKSLKVAAAQDARKCLDCRTKASVKVDAFHDLLLEGMNNIVSDVVLDFRPR